MNKTSRITIKKLHKKCYRAYFTMWDDENPDLKIDVEYDAPTEERLKEKIRRQYPVTRK